MSPIHHFSETEWCGSFPLDDAEKLISRIIANRDAMMKMPSTTPSQRYWSALTTNNNVAVKSTPTSAKSHSR